MKTCPWCGRKNLDSDDYCFNCERALDAVPGEEEALELDVEMRRIHVRKPTNIFKLVLISLLRKLLFLLLALGLFFIVALIAIWVSYDNSVMALVALGVLGVALLVALYYPDIRLSRRIGGRGVSVSLLSNLILLALVVPLGLWFLSSRGYISGAWDFMAHYWWAFVAFVLLGAILAWLTSRRAVVETAHP
jgi:hypothetical protein